MKKELTFDYVCHSCGAVFETSMEATSPGKWTLGQSCSCGVQFDLNNTLLCAIFSLSRRLDELEDNPNPVYK